MRLLCWVVLAFGVAASIHFFLLRGSLWEDELIAITHANQPLPLFFIEVLRNDIHPPLYFLQLDAWLALGANTDRWALANSLAWAAVSLVTMFAVTSAIHGRYTAWIATALLAVLPSFVWSAGTLRMYAALPACVLLTYYANRRWFESRESRFLVLAFLAGLLTAYLHAIEFFFVAFIVLGSLVEAFMTHRGRPQTGPAAFAHRFFRWLVVQAILAVCLLPLAASALIRGSDASTPSSVGAMLGVGGALVAGWKTSALPWARGAGTAIFATLMLAGLASRESRWRTAVIPVGALVVATLIALLVKPIFKQPVFAANVLPFIVLGAATAAARSRPIAAVVAVCIAVLAIGAFPMATRQAQSEGYRDAARAVRGAAQPGDVVVVPNVSVFWGVLRYAIGPRWGRPLSIMPPPNAEWSRLNQRIAQTFGASAPESLGLVPVQSFVDAGGIRYVLGDDAIAATSTAPHVWIVTRARYASEVHVAPDLVESKAFGRPTYGDGELTVRRFDRY